MYVCMNVCTSLNAKKSVLHKKEEVDDSVGPATIYFAL